MRNDFRAWLEESRRWSESTIEKYVSALHGPLSDWATSHGISSQSLPLISNSEEFLGIASQLRKKPEFIERNKKGHGMYGAALERYHEFLLGQVSKHRQQALYPFARELMHLEVAEDAVPFNLKNLEDARNRVLREVVKRQGQPKFRKLLIQAYEGRCAITGCDFLGILEAAHLTLYLGPQTNLVCNGMLLRADLHTLWDLGLLAINPQSHKVWVSPTVVDPYYQSLNGKEPFQPKAPANQPSPAAIERQWSVANGASVA